MKLSLKTFIAAAGAQILTAGAFAPVWSGTLNCPDTPDAVHVREVVATSAPEVKVRAALQNDSKKWQEIVRPLTQKAIKSAKTQRSVLIQEGVEKSCTSPQLYVAQIVPASAKPSGCDHKIVTRPAEENTMWVQVIATCKFAWACCIPQEINSSESSTGYKLEGPLNPNVPQGSQPSVSSSTPPVKGK
jgi:hypothetical protein